jgi:hypothetical protein
LTFSLYALQVVALDDPAMFEQILRQMNEHAEQRG